MNVNADATTEGTRPARLATLLVLAAITIGATFTFLIAPGSGSFELLSTRIIYITMVGTALIAWLTLSVVRPEWRPASRLLPAIAIVLGAFGLSTATSRFPRLSAEMFGYAVLLAGLYLLTVALMRRPRIRRHFEQLVVLFAVIVCGLYLVQVAVEWIGWWDLVGGWAVPPLRPTYVGLRFGSPNPVATLVLMLGVLGLATTALKQGRANRALGAALVVAVGVVVLLTGSRGAWLGGLIASLVVVAAALAMRPEVRAAARSLARSRAGALGALIAIPPIIVATAFAAVSGRLTLEDGGARAGFANSSIRMFESSLATGVGPGTWSVLRATYSDQPAPDLYLPHAHNLYIQVAAEFGIGGIFAGVALAAALAVLIVGAIRSDGTGRRRIGLAALFAVVLFATQQLVDVLVGVPAVILAVALPIAWLDAEDLPALHSPQGSRRSNQGRIGAAASLLALAIVFGILLGLARIEAAAATSYDAVALADRGAWSDAARAFREVETADPNIPIYQFASGVAAANSGDLAGASTDLQSAANADDYSYAWINLAAVRWKLGDPAGARQALGRAERLGLQRAPIGIAAGWLRGQLGDERASVDAFVSALVISPMLAADPFWSSPDGPAGGLKAIVQVVEKRASVSTLLQVALATGQTEDAATYSETLSAGDPDLYPLLVPAVKGGSEAWTRIQELAAARPQDYNRLMWARFVAVIRRDTDADRRYGNWLAVMVGPDWNLPILNRIDFGPARPQLTYTQDRYESVYRRPLPAAQLISLLPQTFGDNGSGTSP